MFVRTIKFYSATVEGTGGAGLPASGGGATTEGGGSPSILGGGAGADTTGGAATMAGADTLDGGSGGDTQAGQDALPTKAEDYKLDLPEGIKRDDPLVAALLAAGIKHKAPNAVVQGLLADMGPEINKMLAAPIEAYKELNADWTRQMRSDPEFGGAKLDATVARINTAIATVAKDQAEISAFKQALDLTGAGNHPAIIRVFARVAARLAEPGHVQGQPAARSMASGAAQMYDKSIPAAGR